VKSGILQQFTRTPGMGPVKDNLEHREPVTGVFARHRGGQLEATAGGTTRFQSAGGVKRDDTQTRYVSRSRESMSAMAIFSPIETIAFQIEECAMQHPAKAPISDRRYFTNSSPCGTADRKT
jgi:hypothetical protein